MRIHRSQLTRLAATAALALALGVPAGAAAKAAKGPRHDTKAYTAVTSRSCQAHHSTRARRACVARLRRHAGTPPAPATSHAPAARPYSRPGAASTSAAATPAPAAPATPAPAAPSAPAVAAPAGTPATPPVASTAPCADTDLLPTAANVATIQAATLCLINQVRGQHGLGALTIDADLQQSAQQHNDDMVAQGYFAHEGPAGDTPLSRIEATGYVDPAFGYILGENIAWGTLDLSSPAAIVNAWVNSPEHLANILAPAYTDTGLAVDPQVPAALGGGAAGAMYTQDFGGHYSGQ